MTRRCAGPSPVVAYHLCGPGKESGEALLKRFKDIRRTLEQGEQFTLCASRSCKLTNTAASWNSMSWLQSLLSACHTGLYNLGSLREEGKAAQHQLWDLHTLLMEMCRQIRDHSVLEEKLSPEEWGEFDGPCYVCSYTQMHLRHP